MGKRRVPPPTWDAEEYGRLLARGRSEAVRAAIAQADNRKQYLAWSEFKHRPVPEGWTAEELWVVTRGDRLVGSHRLELLRDVKGVPFSFGLSQVLVSILHKIDTREKLWKQLLGSRHQPDGTGAESTYRLMAGIEEAHGSSAIEGAVTTRREARELIRSGRDPRNVSELMILNNYRMLQRLDEWIESPLTPQMLLDMQTEITSGTLEHPEDVGRFREDDDVRVVDEATGETVHQPPSWRELTDRIDRLCQFANAGDDEEEFIHPIVRAILLHHQLAYDHPFGDGNGRTARALFMWSVLRARYWWFRSLSISRAVNHSKERYYRAFVDTQMDEGDTTYFVRQQMRCIEQEVERLAEFLTERRRVETWARERMMLESKLNARQVALVAYSLEHPDAVFSAKEHGAFHGVSQPTAWKDLSLLVRDGVLTEDRGRGRRIEYRPSPRLRRLAAERPRA